MIDSFLSAKEVPRCKKGDEECMINSANAMIQNFADGLLTQMFVTLIRH